MILLDTHALIWLAMGSELLGRQSAALTHEARNQGQLSVSAISFWELSMIHARKRVALSADPVQMRTILLETGIIEFPLDGEIAMLSVRLEGLHKDPADRFIAATAIAKGATLITADAKLLAWQHYLKRHDASQ